ncbi:TPA: hypothetical protein ACH3X3_010526 [Trebouxia sp. C0006]
MSVHPQAQVLLDLMAQRPQVQPTDLPVAEYRAYIEKLSRPRTVPEVAEVRDIQLPGAAGPMRARIYNPTPNAAAPQPALIYIHGGGWCLSSVESHDSICRALASQANIVVLSLDYRLAPEHVFPAGLEDCYAATQWIAKHANKLNLDPARLAMGGDSAGGNLTAATLLLTHERKGAPMAFQLLVYPAVHTLASNQSRQQFAEGFALDKTLSNWMFQSYVGGDNKTGLTDPLISPLLAEDLSFMPPAFVLTASHDPLRDEGKAYAERLQQEGVKCPYKCYEGMLHGFLNHTYLLPLDVGEQAISDCARHLQDALHTSNGKL